ncbi:glycoside hydrolase family 43 protein [Bacteroides salyersiae]|uniref:glycoside hydrolase family 43 protein n=1 Tax=Bacteroides salyersiae TaxID=291644 RepID=UPI001C8B81E4|nr:glycoside hydrolase family 43 protein [Bacteroides salyersiae]
MKKSLLTLIMGLLLASCAEKVEKSVYVFSYFMGNGKDGLHLAYSEDGYNWENIDDKSFLTPELSDDKLMRDPCIILGGDGQYHMVWTISWTENGIGYASSKDLINWSEQKLIPVMAHEDSVRNCWAPELTYDKENDEYMIYWSSTITGRFNDTTQASEDNYNHRIYYVTTKDFNTFSETQLLYDQGFNAIDASILKIDEKWVMFVKDESLYPPQKNIRIAYADKLTGPYTKASQPITGNYWAEGPTAVKLGDEWIVYFDKYKKGSFGAIRSKDLKQWEDISDQISLPKGIRHGSILVVPQSIVDNILKNKV